MEGGATFQHSPCCSPHRAAAVRPSRDGETRASIGMSAHDERSASACMQRSAQAKSLPDNGHHLAARLSDSELPMRVILTELPGVTIIEPQIDGQDRKST